MFVFLLLFELWLKPR